MLIPFNELALRHGIVVERAIHAGAHLAEEADAYQAIGARDVLWIEGNPELIPRIESTVAPYGHRVVQALLGAESGRQVDFHVTNFDSMSSSVLEFGTHPDHHPEVVFVGQQRLTLQRLDDVVAANGFMGADFINLDLQGYELECLKGGERTLAEARTLYTEISVDELYRGGVQFQELDAWLNARGFEAVEAKLYGSQRRDGAEHFFGWGDCLYVRSVSPVPYAETHPADAADWFGPATSQPPAGREPGGLRGRLSALLRR
jgi:FkbM family methyltransferase